MRTRHQTLIRDQAPLDSSVLIPAWSRLPLSTARRVRLGCFVYFGCNHLFRLFPVSGIVETRC
jgi:hypothetical protein